jgi:hypothetical protein
MLVGAVVAFVLLAGGAIAAVAYKTNFFRGGSANETKLAVASQPSAQPQRAEANLVGTPASTPQDTLLSQPMTPAPSAQQASEQVAPVTAVNNLQTPAQQPAQPRTQVPAPRQQTASNGTPANVAPTHVAPAPTPRPAPRRGLSGVAVAAIGDRVVLGSVSSAMRNEAEAAGLEVVDANTLPSTEDLVGSRVPVRDLIAQLRDDGYAVLMLARVEPTGSRELSYYGRTDTAYTARVTVTAYDLATGRPFGTPQTESMTYTSINVDSESQDTVAPLARAVARAIRNR